MTEPLRYIDWDCDNHIAIEYERSGECNGCGACCLTTIRFNIQQSKHPQQGGKGVTDKGIWTEISRGHVRRFFQFLPVDPSVYSRCPMLGYDDHKCLLHEKGKVLVQSEWPFSPQNVTPFPTCSYSFREINRWAFEVPQVEAVVNP